MLKRPNKPSELVDTAIDYIQEKAQSSIFERGRRMANLNNLISGDWSPKAMKVKMHGETGIYILGFSLQKYKSGRLMDSLEVFCNCPYAQQATNPCKHTVALAFLLRDFSRNFKKIKIEPLLDHSRNVEEDPFKTKRNAQVPISLQGRQGDYEYLIHEANLEKQMLDINKLSIDFPNEEFHASFFEDEANTKRIAKVTLQKTYTKWTLSCDCAKEVMPFCEHEAQLLALVLIHKRELLNINYFKTQLLYEKANSIPLDIGVLKMIYSLHFA